MSESQKILYIEDDVELGNLVNMILSKQGYEFKVAHTGHEGLAAIHEDPPDLILLDLMMPDMDGWEVYKAIQEDHKTNNIPILIITAKSQRIDQIIGKDIAKVAGYMCKPFHPTELLRQIDSILQNQTV